MLKATLILLVLAITSGAIADSMVKGMNPLEKIIAMRRNEYPTRVYVSEAIFLLIVLATIIMTIVTIVKW